MRPVSEAQTRILRSAKTKSESCSLRKAHMRFLCADITAESELPAWDNSAMDGFAVRASDLPGTLPIAGTVAAGDPPGAVLAQGTTLKIMTGAPLPEGADTVVMRENVDDLGDSAAFKAEPKGRHIRRQGEDVGTGQVVARAGTRLGAGELGLLCALGIAEVPVGKSPRVALIATGSELVAAGQELGPGQKYNSNALVLRSLVEACGGTIHSDVIAGDDPATLTEALRAATEADVVISCGGVSVGDFDFVKDCLEPAGIEQVFWKVAVKPGKPLVFGEFGAGLFFGLPGNPVSTSVTFELFVRPALLALQGAAAVHRPVRHARLAHDYTKVAGRTHFLRASLAYEAGELVVDASRPQGSGTLSSMAQVDALVRVPADSTFVAAGSTVEILVLREA